MQRTLVSGFSVLRTAVLSHARVPAVASLQVTPSIFRSFGADGAGTYLDRDQVTERVMEVVKNFQKVDPSKVTPTASFAKDLGLDSLDAVEVVMAFEEEFALEIPDGEADKLSSCEDAINYIAAHPMAA